MQIQCSTKPMLTEPGVKYFLNETLKQCHKIKEIYYNHLFKVGMMCSFFIILGILLMYKYKGKLTPTEIEQKETDKKHYILSKIRNYHNQNLNRNRN